MNLLEIIFRAWEYRKGFREADGTLKTGLNGFVSYIRYGVKHRKFIRGQR